MPYLVTIKLDRDPAHNPRAKQAGTCPTGAPHCTDTTGEHHTVLVFAPDATSAATRVRTARPGTWITRVEAAVPLESLSLFDTPDDLRPYGYVPLAEATWCESTGPRIGEDVSACTLPAGHAPNLARELGKFGCRYTLDDKVVQDDSIRSPVMWAPVSAAPGPAVRSVRVLAERHYDVNAGRYTWREVTDPQAVYHRSDHDTSAWWAEWRDEDGMISDRRNVGSWEELSVTRVLLDVTEPGRR